ncbi:hypothetical protein [Aliiruegeria lutimaris]|uniref:Uncharacterized protein n=1 Tax=Aliiruegeria lutimaris TaxID=571298 RepID=A0A1G9L6X5_9RHOB|nr:hypothetical protein [Aliiruegeria lutimaris]SDL57566.1 hypothetical protein SAMN04488026_10952 [Aliiruegeria lutimaris]
MTTFIEIVARARMDAIAKALGVDPLPDWEGYSELDRSVSLEIASCIVNGNRIMTPSMAHDIFRAMCPADHEQNVPIEDQPLDLQYLEFVGLHAAIVAAIVNADGPEQGSMFVIMRMALCTTVPEEWVPVPTPA